MITEDKVIEIFCVMDEFCKNFASECDKNLLLEDKEHRHRNRKGQLSYSEIMTILVCYHFGSFANFKPTTTSFIYAGICPTIFLMPFRTTALLNSCPACSST